MQNLPNQSLFRGFSANDWNQLEHPFLTQLFKIFSFLSLSTVSSNAEKIQIPDNKARKLTLNDLIDQYLRLHLNKHPARLKDQTPHLNWWREQYGTRILLNITPGLLVEAREELQKWKNSTQLS